MDILLHKKEGEIMGFWIQASSPRFTNEFDIEDENLTEAVETIFPLWTENMYIIWNNIHISLSYKYDVSVMLLDILDMIEKIESKAAGDLEIRWSSDSFNCKWNMHWCSEELTVISEWENVVGNIRKILDDSGGIIVTKKKFLSEWKKVIANVVKGLYECKYLIHLESDIRRLESVLSLIENNGILYKIDEKILNLKGD